MDVLTLIFPVFAVIVTGYAFARFQVLPDSIAGALTQFVYYTAIPAVLFVIIAQQDIADLANWPFIAVYAGPAFVVFLALFFGAHLLRKLSWGDATMLAILMSKDSASSLLTREPRSSSTSSLVLAVCAI